MRKYTLNIFCLVFLFICSCQNDNIIENAPIENQAENLSATEISAQDAEKILLNFIQNSKPALSKTRSVNANVFVKAANKRYCGEQMTRSGSSLPIAFYNFALESSSGEGFAIVCGDKRFPQVIAYSEKGALDEVANCGNTFLANYVQNLPEAVAILIENRNGIPNLTHRYVGGFPYEDISNVAHSWETDSTAERVVFLEESTTWEQKAPYNKLITINPKTNQPYPVGCSNIACANIMAYYCYPEKYNWTALKQFRVVIEGYQPDTVVTEAAQLCKDLFIANKSVSNDEGTGTKTEDVYTGLQSFGYVSNLVMDYNLDSIRASLENLNPIYMRGQDPSKNSGHAFVVRGYWEVIPKDISVMDTTVSLGINWGWMAGFGDGFYLAQYAHMNLIALGLYPMIFTEYGPEYSKYSYADKMKIITRIRPRNR